MLRFSLKMMFALIGLSGLMLATAQSYQRHQALLLSAEKLHFKVNTNADIHERYKNEVVPLRRSIKRREEEIAERASLTESLGQVFNRSTIDQTVIVSRESVISTHKVRTFSRNRTHRERVKVFVPDDRPCELQVCFGDRNTKTGNYSEFSEPEDVTLPLVAGENLIEAFFDGYNVPNSFSLVNHQTGQAVYSRSNVVSEDGRSFVGGQGSADPQYYERGRGIPSIIAIWPSGRTSIRAQLIEVSP